MKKILALLIVLLLCISSTGCRVSQGKNKEYWQVAFEINKSSFEKTNEFLLEQYSLAKTDRLTFALSLLKPEKKIDKIYSGYLHGYIYLDDETKQLLTDISTVFRYDFSTISVEKKRISYYGEGNEMFVYSLDGKKPKTFWPDGTKAKFSTYSLGDNWYYLFLKQR